MRKTAKAEEQGALLHPLPAVSLLRASREVPSSAGDTGAAAPPRDAARWSIWRIAPWPPRAILRSRKAQSYYEIQLNGKFCHADGSLSSAGLVLCCNRQPSWTGRTFRTRLLKESGITSIFRLRWRQRLGIITVVCSRVLDFFFFFQS